MKWGGGNIDKYLGPCIYKFAAYLGIIVIIPEIFADFNSQFNRLAMNLELNRCSCIS